MHAYKLSFLDFTTVCYTIFVPISSLLKSEYEVQLLHILVNTGMVWFKMFTNLTDVRLYLSAGLIFLSF